MSRTFRGDIPLFTKGDGMMRSKYGELFSSLGYDALDTIFGINPQLILQSEVKKLIQLIGLSEENESLEAEIRNIVNQNYNNNEMKLKLLLHLADRHNQYKKEGKQ